MTSYSNPLRLLGTAIFGIGLLWLSAAVSAQESRIDDGKGIEVLASGPVHEAFAEPIVFDAKPGLIVPKAPPGLVEELPPDQKPAGANVVWIPGYWNWDEDRDDFLWVSGFWRALPPSREWVPGYWVEVTGGWQWVSGYWANAVTEDTEYLPEPPQTLEAGPPTMPPSADHFWVPGCWYWRDARYMWRPGYWTVGQSDWMWSPAHYVWTPRGFVFVSGYWDYALPRRGMLFAPVYFNSPFYSRPGYFYTPSLVVDLGIMTNHFFVGLGQRHYYFGDYYASSYGDRGMYPWFAFSSSRFGYDPIYAHYHHRHARTDRNWASRVRSEYEFRRDHENARPERVASLTPRFQRQDGQRADGGRSLVQPLAQFAAAAGIRGTLETLPSSQRTEVAKVAQQTREFTKNRMTTETDPNAKSSLIPIPEGQSKKNEIQPSQDAKAKVDGAGKELRSTIVKRPKSPIVDVPNVDASKGTKGVTPALPETPKPNANVQPKAPGKNLPAVPRATPKIEPKSPTTPDKPVVPKLEPKPSTKEPPLPKVEPKPPVTTPAVPRVEPPKVQPQIPKAEPPKAQPQIPKVEPPRVQPQIPKAVPPPKVRPEVPRADPPPKIRPEVPRVEPKQPRPSPPADRPREPKLNPPKPENEPKR